MVKHNNMHITHPNDFVIIYLSNYMFSVQILTNMCVWSTPLSMSYVCKLHLVERGIFIFPLPLYDVNSCIIVRYQLLPELMGNFSEWVGVHTHKHSGKFTDPIKVATCPGLRSDVQTIHIFRVSHMPTCFAFAVRLLLRTLVTCIAEGLGE